MSHIVGIFHSEADVGKALDAIYALDIDSDDVTLLRGTGQPGDGSTSTGEGTGVAVPMGVFTNPGHGSQSNQAAGPALVATGVFKDLPLDEEGSAYFRRIADDGALVVFVDTDDDDERTTTIEKIMRDSNPSRLEKL